MQNKKYNPGNKVRLKEDSEYFDQSKGNIGEVVENNGFWSPFDSDSISVRWSHGDVDSYPANDLIPVSDSPHLTLDSMYAHFLSNNPKQELPPYTLTWSTATGDNSAKEHMTKLTDAQQRNLSDDAKALVQAGYYNDDLTLADEDHFMDFLLTKFEADYAAQAKAELQAEAEKKALAETVK
jgi:hypothetical protein